MRIAPRSKARVVRLGLDLEGRTAHAPDARARLRGELGLDESTFVVGWLGRMTDIKRVDDLLRAFARLLEREPDSALVLVGDGPLRRDLEQTASELGIAAACRFTGYLDDVAECYAAFDAVALSSANEGTPVTVIEAQAAGLPVVSTDVGGVRDVVADGESGFLVPPGDIEAMADALAMLSGAPELRSSFGERGRAVLTRYSVPRLVDDLDALYRELLAADVVEKRPPASDACRAAAAPACRADTGRSPGEATAARGPSLAVLPARGRRHAVAHAVVRRVPRLARTRRDRDLRVPESSARRDPA